MNNAVWTYVALSECADCTKPARLYRPFVAGLPVVGFHGVCEACRANYTPGIAKRGDPGDAEDEG